MKSKILMTLLMAITAALNAQNWSGTTPGNIYYNSGNVGIGLTNPNFGLSINSIEDQTVLGGNAKSVVRIMNGYASAFGRRSEVQFGLSQIQNELLAVIAAEYSSWNGFIGGDLLFGTTPTNSSAIFERMRIKWDGNVGIGTSNPSAKLDIFGANSNSVNLILSANYVDKYRWRLKTIDRGNSIDMDFTASDGADNEETVLKLTRSNSTRPEFQLYNNAIVANNGNVGIGTENTANAKLSVAGDINSREVRVTINAGSDFVFQDNYELRTLNEVYPSDQPILLRMVS